MAFIFNKRNKNKKGSGGGKKKSKWLKKKGKKSSKFASTELPVIEEEEQNREKDLEVIDTFFGNVYNNNKDSVLDFTDISRASDDAKGDDLILNSYNTDGTIDGSELKSDVEVPVKSDVEVPVVENTFFSQQLAVAAADAVTMFQRMSSSISVATAPVPVQEETKGAEEEKTDDAIDGLEEKDVGGDDDAITEDIGNNQEAEGEKGDNTVEKDTSEDGGWLGDEAAKGSTSSEDACADEKDISNDQVSPANDLAQFGSDVKNTDVAKQDADPTVVVATGDTTESAKDVEEDDEEDGSPFNVCTDLFRF